MALVGLMPPASRRHPLRRPRSCGHAGVGAGALLAYSSQEVYIFPLTVRENLLYGLKHRPPERPPADEAERRRREHYIAEAIRCGNPPFDAEGDWIDYAAAGASGPEDIDERLLEVLRTVELEEDVYQLGLRRTIDPERDPSARREPGGGAPRPARPAGGAGSARLVEVFDRARYNKNMSVAENLLFGTPVDARLSMDAIAQNPYVRQVLDRVGLTQDLLAMGRKIAETMVELFADLPPGHPFFEQFSFISAEDLPAVQAMLDRLGKQGWRGCRTRTAAGCCA